MGHTEGVDRSELFSAYFVRFAFWRGAAVAEDSAVCAEVSEILLLQGFANLHVLGEDAPAMLGVQSGPPFNIFREATR